MSKTSELAHLFRALKASAAARALPKFTDRRARSSGPTSASPRRCSPPRWPPGQPRRWVADQAARFPQRKALEACDFAFQRSVRRQDVKHLGQLDFLHAKESVVLLGAADPGSHCTSASTH